MGWLTGREEATSQGKAALEESQEEYIANESENGTLEEGLTIGYRIPKEWG